MHALFSRANWLLFVSLALFLSVSPAYSEERWIHLSTAHFDMYTTNNEKQAIAALQKFEQVRYFFMQSSYSKTVPEDQVRIIAFRSEKEYKPYRLNQGSFAYYLRSRKVDYIIMQDIEPSHYQTAAHEYTHLIVEHTGVKLPLWLNEGLAELYSSIEPHGDRALVGRPIPGRAQVLATTRWMPLKAVFSVDQNSPYYNEGSKMSIFYAESWALTHMLSLSDLYRSRFNQFLTSVSAGHSTEDALQAVYGKSPDQVMEDLQNYLHRSAVSAADFPVKLGKQSLEPQVTSASYLDVELTLADLLAAKAPTQTQAAERLSDLAKQYPDSAGVQESLGYLYWQQNDLAKARGCFKLAMLNGSKNSEMLFHYAELLRLSEAPADDISDALHRATAIKPDFLEAWFNLGMSEMSAHHWGAARSAFLRVNDIDAERAYSLFSSLAWCDLQLKDIAGANEMAQKAKHYARLPDQVSQADDMTRYLSSLDDSDSVAAATPVAAKNRIPEPQTTAEKPLLARDVPSGHWDNAIHVVALVKSMECHFRHPRLRVVVDSKDLMLDVGDTGKVVVRNNDTNYFSLTCGDLQPARTMDIFYTPSKQPGLDGEVKEIVF
jgi:tetratricopeptide (TPR) repeat protein